MSISLEHPVLKSVHSLKLECAILSWFKLNGLFYTLCSVIHNVFLKLNACYYEFENVSINSSCSES